MNKLGDGIAVSMSVLLKLLLDLCLWHSAIASRGSAVREVGLLASVLLRDSSPRDVRVLWSFGAVHILRQPLEEEEEEEGGV